MSDIILKTENLSKKYGNQVVLDAVSIQINKGDIYGFIGENGAGKTTFMRAISGLIHKDSGEIALFSNNNYRNELHRVGFVIDSPNSINLYENNTATENLTIYCKLQDVELGRIQEVLDLVNLPEYKSKKKVKNFSTGMRQALRIAVSLISVPEFLVLDEPLSGLDQTHIEYVAKMIKRLNTERGVTMMVSCHILRELEMYATKYGFIHKGKLIYECESNQLPDSLVTTYKSLIGAE